MQRIRDMRMRGYGGEEATSELQIGSLLTDLGEMDKDMALLYPRISENLFVTKYLLPFAGIGEDIKENYATYLSWIMDVAGNYNVPVHVCDNNNQHNILFTVPAISNINIINPTKTDTRQIREVVSMAIDARHLQPHRWESILSNNLYSVMRKIYDKNNIVTEDQKVWASIFTRYENILKDKKPLMEIKNGPNEESNKQLAQAKADYSEMDDPV